MTLEAQPDTPSKELGVPLPSPAVTEHCEKVMAASREDTGLEQSGMDLVRGVAKYYVRAMSNFAEKTAVLAPLLEAARRDPGGIHAKHPRTLSGSEAGLVPLAFLTAYRLNECRQVFIAQCDLVCHAGQSMLKVFYISNRPSLPQPHPRNAEGLAFGEPCFLHVLSLHARLSAYNTSDLVRS